MCGWRGAPLSQSPCHSLPPKGSLEEWPDFHCPPHAPFQETLHKQRMTLLLPHLIPAQCICQAPIMCQVLPGSMPGSGDTAVDVPALDVPLVARQAKRQPQHSAQNAMIGIAPGLMRAHGMAVGSIKERGELGRDFGTILVKRGSLPSGSSQPRGRRAASQSSPAPQGCL